MATLLHLRARADVAAPPPRCRRGAMRAAKGPPQLPLQRQLRGMRRAAPPAQAALQEDEVFERGRSRSTLNRPVVQWYPGHIARAERLLKEQLSMVDVVLEVRDARIPLATTHPALAEWIGREKAHLIVLNRQDLITKVEQRQWASVVRQLEHRKAFFTDSKTGEGVKKLAKAVLDAGRGINLKRKKRGLKPRPVRSQRGPPRCREGGRHWLSQRRQVGPREPPVQSEAMRLGAQARRHQDAKVAAGMSCTEPKRG
eukprot:scaffold699_cov385-Prasinococcus_capsulatus_cf.AAC.5